MRLAQLPRRPSEIWNLEDEGYDAIAIRQFDFAHLDFQDWLEGKRSEQKWTRVPQHPKGKTQVPRYPNDREILKLYYPERHVASDVDQVAAAVTTDELLELMDSDDWSVPDASWES